MSAFFPQNQTDSPGVHPPSGGDVYTGTQTVGYGYAGWTGGPRENKYDVGAGVFKDDTFDFLTTSADAGAFAPTEGAGTQFGVKGEGTSFQARADLGTLAELLTLGQANTSNTVQGGFENFLSGEVHGPRGAAEASVGTDGLFVGGGVDGVGVSAKIGGAEYDWLAGSEVSVGAGLGFGAGGGISWSDDDKDGYNELGVSLGVKWWEGGNVGAKTELGGHVANFATQNLFGMPPEEAIMKGGDALLQWLAGEERGLEPGPPAQEK